MKRGACESFNCRDLFAVYFGDRRDAGTGGGAVDVNRTRAAQRHSAAKLCPRKIQHFPNYPKQRHVGRNINSNRLTVYRKIESHWDSFRTRLAPPGLQPDQPEAQSTAFL